MVSLGPVFAGTIKHKLLSLCALLHVVMGGIKRLIEQNNNSGLLSHLDSVTCMHTCWALTTVTEYTVCFGLQRSWVFTHWLPVVRPMMELEVKRRTTVSTTCNLSLFN